MNWYVLQCKPNQLQRASLNLDNQGYESWCPRVATERIVRRKIVSVEEPVFPGYLFIRLSAHSNWSALNATRGVSRVVSFNGRPQRAQDELVAQLQRHYETGKVARELFKPGESVRIEEGCFRHLEAIVKAVTPDSRILVLLRILQTEQTLEVDASCLRKAG